MTVHRNGEASNPTELQVLEKKCLAFLSSNRNLSESIGDLADKARWRMRSSWRWYIRYTS
jgi:hypothetical protein